jgi:hypothetical protein
MPAFDGLMRESEMWDVINLLRAQAEAEEAKPMGSAVQSWAIEAPDFTFQIDHNRQESLADQRGHSNVLLVLFDPIESRARVRALSNAQMELQQAGLRVIAIPARAEGAARDLRKSRLRSSRASTEELPRPMRFFRSGPSIRPNMPNS